MRWIYGFGDGEADGGRGDRELLGGKGAELAEMSRLGLHVPPGFTITTEACTAYLAEGEAPPDLWDELERAVGELEELAGRGFGDPEGEPLLLSVRSGPPSPCPG